METRNSRNPEVLRIRRLQPILYFEIRFSLFILLLAGGCGAPGEPTPPSPPVPVAVTDLAAQQAGDAVQLTFTMPPKTVAGERLAETTRAPSQPLSPQEMQIAQMAATGLSNREIADRLFLSHRTVGAHLYRVYPKLGIASRSELPRALASTELAITR